MVAALGDDAHVARAARALRAPAARRCATALEAARLPHRAQRGEPLPVGDARRVLLGHRRRTSPSCGILVAPGDFYGAGGRAVRTVAFTATDERVAAAVRRLSAAERTARGTAHATGPRESVSSRGPCAVRRRAAARCSPPGGQPSAAAAGGGGQAARQPGSSRRRGLRRAAPAVPPTACPAAWPAAPLRGRHARVFDGLPTVLPGGRAAVSTALPPVSPARRRLLGGAVDGVADARAPSSGGQPAQVGRPAAAPAARAAPAAPTRGAAPARPAARPGRSDGSGGGTWCSFDGEDYGFGRATCPLGGRSDYR